MNYLISLNKVFPWNDKSIFNCFLMILLSYYYNSDDNER